MSMTNKEYIETFINRHNLNPEYEVLSTYPHKTWDDVIGIVLNKSDDPAEHEIKLDDIIFDVESEFTEDVFKQWFKDFVETGIILKDWLSSPQIKYIPNELNCNDTILEFKERLYSMFNNVQNRMNVAIGTLEQSINEDDNTYKIVDDMKEDVNK